MAANDYKVFPSAAGGLSLSTAALAWGYSSYGTIVTSGNNTTGLLVNRISVHLDITTVTDDATNEAVIELYYGVSDTLFAQIPVTWKVDTKVNHAHNPQTVILPEPFVVPAGNQVRARVADQSTSILAYTLKVHYREPEVLLSQAAYRFYNIGGESDASNPIVGTNVATLNDAVDKTSFTVTSYAGSGELQILSVSSKVTSGTPNTPTATSSGLTWTQIATQLDNGGLDRLTLFRAVGTTSTAITIDFAGQTQTGVVAHVTRYRNTDNSGTNGSNAIVQSSAVTSSGAVSNIDATLSAFASSDNATHSSSLTGNASAMNLPTGFTSLQSTAATAGSLRTAYTASNDTSVDIVMTAGTSTISAIVLELKAAKTTALAAQDTAIISDTSSGDVDLQLRTRLQETGGGQGASTDDYQLQYELNDSGNWYNVSNGASSAATSLADSQQSTIGLAYYFDASDAAVSDPDSNFAGEASLVDSSDTTTLSAVTNFGSASSNYLKIEGTNAPASGIDIRSVHVQAVGVVSTDLIYYQPQLLNTPTGGWTWAKLQALETRFWIEDVGGGAVDWVCNVYTDGEAETIGNSVVIAPDEDSLTDIAKIKLIVNQAVRGYSSDYITEGYSTTNRLGSGSGSFVAGKISEDALLDNHQITASNYTEHLYAITLESSALVNADTLDFRVLRNGATTGMTYTVTPRITASIPISTPSDDFDDNSLSAEWSEALAGDASRINEQNGRIEITHPVGSQYNTLVRVKSYNLTSSSFYIEVTDAGNQSQVSHEVQLMAYLDGNNKVWLMANNGSIKAFKLVAGVQAQVGSNITYNSTTHRWFRISESGGTISFDTAPDGSTWTSRFTLANPFAITAIKPALVVGNWQAEASESYGYFDNFNTAPAGPPTQNLTVGLLTNTSTLYEPTLTPQAISITAPLITNTSTLYAPTLTPQAISITAPLITNTSTLYEPTLSVQAITLTLPLISSTNTLYSPTLTPQAITITAPLYTNTNTLYEPVITQVQTLEPPLIASTNVLYEPTLAPQAISITAPLYTNTSTLYAPTISAGAVTLDLPLINNSNTLYAPTLTVTAITITAPLLTNTNTLYAPTLTAGAISIDVPLLSNTNTLYSPSLIQNITAPLLTNTSTLYSPELYAVISISPALYTNTSTLYVPTLTVGAVSLALPLLTNTNTLYSPTLNVQAITLDAPLLTNSNTLYSPTLTSGAVTISPALYTNTNTLYSPTLTVGAITITAPLLSNTNTLYSPTLSAGAISIEAPLITNTSTLYSPTLSVQAVTIDVPLLTNSNTLYAPTIAINAVTLDVPLLSNTNSLYEPTLTAGAVSLTVPLHTNTNTLYAPTLNAIYQIVAPFIDSTSALYAPSLIQNLTAPLITNSSTLYSPTLTPQAVTLSPPLIASTNELYAPLVFAGEGTIYPPLYTNTSVLYEPTITPQPVTLTPPLLTNTSTLYSPTLTTGAVTVEPPLINSVNTLYSPTLTSGAVQIEPPLLSNSSTLYTPTLSAGAVTLSLPLIDSTNQLYAPTIQTTESNIYPPLINSTSVLYAPSLTPQAVTLSTPLITNLSTLYTPSLSVQAITISPPVINSSNVLYTPNLTPQAVGLSVPFLESLAQLFPPTVTYDSQNLEVPFIDHTNSLYAPVLTGSSMTGTVVVLSTNSKASPLSQGKTATVIHQNYKPTEVTLSMKQKTITLSSKG